MQNRLSSVDKASVSLQYDSHKNRPGFTILELLVTFGIIGLLLSLLLPAVSTAREAARSMQCKNNLRQIGIALQNYHDVCDALPSGWQWESTGKSAYGWLVPLLPFLDQQSIYDVVDRDMTVDHIKNQPARNLSISFFLCPSDVTSTTFMLYEGDESEEGDVTEEVATPLFELPTANYVGVFGSIEADDETPAPPGDGTFCEFRSFRYQDLTGGLSNTLIVGERMMATVPSTWLGIDRLGEDAACRLVGSAIENPNCSECDECEFSSRHAGGTNFLWADGHVKLLSESVETVVYKQLVRRVKN